MSRFHYSVAIALAIALAVVMSGFVFGQAASTAAKGQAPAANKGLGAAAIRVDTIKPTGKVWTKKTPDGQPDIQGYWTNTTYTPLTRANNVNKEYYTLQEYEQLVARGAEGDEGR